MEMLYNAYDNAQHMAGNIHNSTGMPVLAFETTPADVPPPPRKESDREEDARLRKEKFPGLSSMPGFMFSLMPRKEKVLEDDLGRVMMGLCPTLEIELVPVPELPQLQPLGRRSGSDSDCCMLMCIQFRNKRSLVNENYFHLGGGWGGEKKMVVVSVWMVRCVGSVGHDVVFI